MLPINKIRLPEHRSQTLAHITQRNQIRCTVRILAHKSPRMTSRQQPPHHLAAPGRLPPKSGSLKQCRNLRIPSQSRRAPGRHTDQTAAKAKVLTCTNVCRSVTRGGLNLIHQQKPDRALPRSDRHRRTHRRPEWNAVAGASANSPHMSTSTSMTCVGGSRPSRTRPSTSPTGSTPLCTQHVNPSTRGQPDSAPFNAVHCDREALNDRIQDTAKNYAARSTNRRRANTSAHRRPACRAREPTPRPAQVIVAELPIRVR